MKKIIVLSLVLCNSFVAFSQYKELIEEIKNQQMTIDSLQNKVIKPLQESVATITNKQDAELKKMQTQAKALQNDTANLHKQIKRLDKNNIKDLETRLQGKTDSIILLKSAITEKDNYISAERLAEEQKLREEKEKGKSEALSNVVNGYKNKKFDDLIKSSTKLSVQRDMQLIGNNEDVKPIVSDLEKYFNAEELLTKKMDVAQIKNAQTQLNLIKRQSALLDRLKENIEYYKDFNDELKKTIEKLIDLDKRKVAAGDTEIQKLKFNEIVSELANYMYNYYDYGSYPYLSGIVLEVIKRKQPNADEDIRDLLSKL